METKEESLSDFIILGKDLPDTKVVTVKDVSKFVARLKEDIESYGMTSDNMMEEDTERIFDFIKNRFGEMKYES